MSRENAIADELKKFRAAYATRIALLIRGHNHPAVKGLLSDQTIDEISWLMVDFFSNLNNNNNNVMDNQDSSDVKAKKSFLDALSEID